MVAGEASTTTAAESFATAQEPSGSSGEKTTTSGESPGDVTKSSGASAPPTRKPREQQTPAPTVFYRGKEGKAITVSSNYLQLEMEKDMGLFQYEVRFEPQLDGTNQRRRALYGLENVLGATKSFDGAATLNLPRKLPQDTAKYDSQTADGTPVKVTINFKSERRDGPEVVRHYNILFNRVLRALKLTQHNRNYYDPKGAHHIRQYNIQVRTKNQKI